MIIFFNFRDLVIDLVIDFVEGGMESAVPSKHAVLSNRRMCNHA